MDGLLPLVRTCMPQRGPLEMLLWLIITCVAVVTYT